MSWKTVYIDEKSLVSLNMNSMKIKVDEEYIKVNICDIQTVIFAHDGVTITLPLINKLIENNVGIIICDKKKDPNGIFLPFNCHSLVFKQLNKQINWKLTSKKKLWKIIIEQKIKTEIVVLEKINKTDKIDNLNVYRNNVKSNDVTNREGVAAKLYFKEIFGSEYFRNGIDSRNYALNYGYKILASFISRHIAARGYVVQLGIFHRGESNPFNLTYDFIEIFRYVIDIWVYFNIKEDDVVGMKQRHELVDILNIKLEYDNKKCRLSYVIEKVINDYFLFLNDEKDTIIFPKYKSLEYETT